MGEEKRHQLMQNLFGDQSEEEEEEVDSEHESNPQPNSGCNKIIYCATALSTISGDLYRADQRGVYNLTKAFQDYNNKMAQLRAGQSSKSKLTIVKFKTLEPVDGWEVRQGTYFQDVVASKYDGGMDAKFEYFTRDAVFSGKRKTKLGF
ncbi:hypothetical protein DVH24_016064 [Malus domestica]|uniref:Uncharacterized protein n=1 Tax=Malus domestica TaxID=3750 RepID=A0A498JGR1_MALDO|nr:hypothetical protein DVH24_016064 [Malus domestica]